MNAIECFEYLLRHTDYITGVLTAFPAFEAIFDAYKPLFEATVLFEGAEYPTVYMVLPNLHHFMVELQRISDGGLVVRDDLSEVDPSMYTKRFCATILGDLVKVEVIDFCLVGCFLHSFFQGLGFCKKFSLRS